MTTERASECDIPELIRLRLAYLREDYGTLSAETEAQILRQLPGYFSGHLNRDLFVFLCKDAARVIGCCFLLITEKPANPSFPGGKTGTVLNVYTEPAYRKRGIASQLMRSLLAQAAERGLDYVELQATDAGYALYRSLGFSDAVSAYHSMKYTFDRK